jgi:AcrR family transcriptional regulator
MTVRRSVKSPATPRRGRPASFDRDEALAAAMNVFWLKGYEGATLEDLLAAMGGITAPSLYNAFGSKEELYKAAVDLYVSTVGETPVRALERAPSARAGVEALLRTATDVFCRPGGPRGCMLVSSAAKCGRGNEAVEAYARSVRLTALDPIARRLERAVKEGELPASLDIARLSAFYATVAQGLGLRAGDGVSRAELMAVIDGAMAAWDALAKPSRKPSHLRGRGRKPARAE